MNPRLKQLSTVDNTGMSPAARSFIALDSGGIPDYTSTSTDLDLIGTFAVRNSGNTFDACRMSDSINTIQMVSNWTIQWSDATTSLSTIDLVLGREAAGGLRISDSTNTANAGIGLYGASGIDDVWLTYSAAGIARIGTSQGSSDGTLQLNTVQIATADALMNANGFTVDSTSYMQWTDSTTYSGTVDLRLSRDGTAGSLKIHDPSGSTNSGLGLFATDGTTDVWLTYGGSSGNLAVGDAKGGTQGSIRTGSFIARSGGTDKSQMQNSIGVILANDLGIEWDSTINITGGIRDIGIERSAAGVLSIFDPSAANSTSLRISNAANSAGVYLNYSAVGLYVGQGPAANNAAVYADAFRATSDGTLSNPAFNFTTDPNTGIARLDTDTLGIVAGGLTVLEISNNGPEFVVLWENGGNGVYMSTEPSLPIVEFSSSSALNGDAGVLGYALMLNDRSADPLLLSNGQCVIWQSDGTGTGNDGDVLLKIADSLGSTRTVVLSDAGTGGGGGGGTGTGPVERFSESATGPWALDSDDYGKTLTDGTAVTIVEFDLPIAAQSGGPYTFLVESGSGIRVYAAAGDMIQVGNLMTTATGGDSIESSTVGDVITIRAINSSTWFATSGIGSWTVN